MGNPITTNKEDLSLVQLLEKIIEKIERLEKKHLAATNTPELIHARKQVSSIKKTLELVLKKLIPLVDNQKLISATDLLWHTTTFYTLKNNLEELAGLFRSRNWRLWNEVKNALPDIIRNAQIEQKNNSLLTFDKVLIQQLDAQKEQFFKKPLQIPNKKEDMDTLFLQLKKQLSEFELDQINPGELNVTKLIEWLNDDLSDTLEQQAASVIIHPMTLELTLFMADLFQELPDTLAHFIPFLNPQTLCTIINSELGQVFIRMIFDANGSIEHLNQEGSDLSFAYKITSNANKKKPTIQIIDASQLYSGQCGLWRPKNKPTEEELRQLSHSYYILTDKELFYFDKSTHALTTIPLNQSAIDPYQPQSLNVYFHKERKIEVLSPSQLDVITEKTSNPNISRHQHTDYRSALESLIVAAINGGVAYCEETLTVKELCAKSNLLQNYIVYESETIKEDVRLFDLSVNSHKQNANRLSQGGYPVESFYEQVKTSHEEIEKNRQLIEANNSLQAKLSIKSTDYASKSFIELLTAHPLHDQVAIDQKAGYDLSYVNKPLPTCALGRSYSDNNLIIIPINNALELLIQTQAKSLQQLQRSLLNTQRQLEDFRQKTLTSWMDALQKGFNHQLEHYQRELDLLIKASSFERAQTNLGLDADITERKLELVELENKNAHLEQLHTKARQWSHNPFGDVDTIQDDFVKNKLATLDHNLAPAIALFLEKMNTEKLQLKQRTSVTTQQLKHLLLEKEHGIEHAKFLKELVTLKAMKEDTLAHQATLQIKIGQLESQLGNTTTIKALQNQLDELKEKNKTTIQEAITVCQKPREFFNEPKLLENEAISAERFIDFVKDEERLLARLTSELDTPILTLDEHAFLKKAYMKVNGSEKIPLLEIDSLLETNQGFNCLIDLLDLENTVNLKELDSRWFSTASWEDFKVCQDNYNIPKIKTLLQEKIAKKLAIMDAFITKKDLLEWTSALLKQIKNEFLTVDNESICCKTKIDNECNQQIQSLTTLKTEQEKVSTTLPLIDLMTDLVEALKTHTDWINSFKDKEDSVARIEASKGKLQSKINAFSKRLNDTNLENTYPTFQSKLDAFLIQADMTLARELMTNFKACCVRFYNEHEASTQTIKEHYLELIADKAMLSQERVNVITHLMDKIKILLKSLDKHETYIENEFASIRKKAQRTLIHLEQTPNQAEQLEAHQREKQNVMEIQCQLETYLGNQHLFQKWMAIIARDKELIEALDKKATLFVNIKDKSPEGKTLFQHNKSKLENVRKTLIDMERQVNQAEIDTLCDAPNQTTLKKHLLTLDSARQNTLYQLEESEKINLDIENRIEARGARVRDLSNQLDLYLTQRNERFDWKDCLDARDKDSRTLRVTTLKEHLADYDDSGDSLALRKALLETQKNIPKGRLSRELDNVLLSIVELDQKRPITYDSQTISPTPQAILQNHPNPAYAQSLDLLYQQIKSLLDFGQTQTDETDKATLVTLANALKNDLNYFVVNLQTNTPSLEAYETFKEEFRIRLHSQDEALNQHRDLWRPFIAILANLALATLTLGVAVGAKLIHSKKTTGQFSFFCDKTERLETIEDFDESIKNLQVPTVA